MHDHDHARLLYVCYFKRPAPANRRASSRPGEVTMGTPTCPSCHTPLERHCPSKACTWWRCTHCKIFGHDAHGQRPAAWAHG
jgi:hypothetical protein